MNQQTQNSPSKPFEPVTVSDTEGEAVTVKVADAYGKPAVWIHERDDDHGITLLPNEAGRLGEVLIRASAAAGSPTAKQFLETVQKYVARDMARRLDEASDDDTIDDDDLLDDDQDEEDISLEDRIARVEALHDLARKMEASGARNVGEYYAMQQEAAAKANTDTVR